jgi:cytochrome oxidase assembly protein ShyY1
VTQTPQANEVHQTDGRPVPEQRDAHLTRTLVWIGVAGLSAALAFTVVRALISRQPADPTSQRIQQLIDEANQLLKTLDDQRHIG